MAPPITLDYDAASDDLSHQHPQDDQTMVEDDLTVEQVNGGSTRFYVVPREEGIDAGARRGPSPLSREGQLALDDATPVGAEEPSEVPSPPSVEGGSDIRLDTLLVEGLPITQMSTSRLFAYVAHFGAQPLGLEWVDDERCNVVFPTEESARLALEYLCPVTDMPTDMLAPLPNLQTILETPDDEWDTDTISSLVAPRKAHRVPGKLYTAIEKQTAKSQAAELQGSGPDGTSALPDDVPEIYREMEAADRRQRLEKPEYVALAKLHSALYVRHAVKDFDVKPSRAASRSQWYKEHGHEAGKEIVPRLLDVGEMGESVELFPGAPRRAFGSAGLPPRPEHGTGVASGSNARGKGGMERRAVMDELDSQLDAHVASRNNDDGDDAAALHERKLEGQMMSDLIDDGSAGGRRDLLDRFKGEGRRGRPSRSSASRWGHDDFERHGADQSRHRGGRGGRTNRETDGRAARDALDEDLDEMLDARDRMRSASPVPRGGGGGGEGRVKIKGRGTMKAPGGSQGWGRPGGNGGDDEEPWGNYGTERYGQTKGKDRRRRGGGEAKSASADLASRLGDGKAGR